MKIKCTMEKAKQVLKDKYNFNLKDIVIEVNLCKVSSKL